MSYQEAIELLKKRAKDKGLSQTEIAERSHLSDAQVSRIFKLKSIASDDSLKSLAVAVDYPVEETLRIAKRLPPKPETDSLTEEGIYLLQLIKGKHKEEAIRYLQFIAEEQDKQEHGEYDTKSKSRVATT